MKYKVGDKVRVRSDLAENRLYFMDDGETSNCVVSVMMSFRGKVVTINRTIFHQYEIEENSCLWTDGMFEGLAETKFHVYDTVKHEKYGLGTVIKIGSLIDVDFDEKPFDRPSLKNNILHCNKERLTVVEAYTGGEDQ